MSIQQQADDLHELIKGSRNLIADGRFVDISEVEQKMTRLFNTVSEHPEACLNVDVELLAGSLAHLMGELDNLETDLTRQHDSLNAEDTVAPKSAAAAYQS
jgi:septation ring formation regulator EzrA